MGLKVLDILALAIGLFGVVTIVWGALKTLFRFFRMEYAGWQNRPSSFDAEFLRLDFGTYLLLGLEFLIAADILHTMIKPDIQRLITLGSIVAIRTVISFFLNREIRQSPLANKAASPSPAEKRAP